VGFDVATGTRRSIPGGSLGGTLAGFRIDGTAAMTWQREAPESLIVVDIATGRAARLPVGGPFVRVR
jgi:hypothetical protein